MDGKQSAVISKYREMGLPYAAHLDLTWRCPLSCVHCYLKGLTAAELSTDEWLRVLDELAWLKSMSVLLSGGEILVRTDLTKILRRAVDLHFMVKLKTSGNGASRRRLKELAALRPYGVDISFYSDRPDVHDAVTGVVGSFQSSVEAAHAFLEAGVQVVAAVTLLRGHSEDAATVSAGLTALGVGPVTFNNLTDAFCADPNVESLLLPDRLLDQQYEMYAEAVGPSH